MSKSFKIVSVDMENRKITMEEIETKEITIEKENWAPGIWAGTEGAEFTDEQIFKDWVKGKPTGQIIEDGRDD